MGALEAARRRRLAIPAEFLEGTAALPVERVAEIAGVSVQTVNRWRRSGVRIIHDATLLRLADYLGAGEVPMGRRRPRATDTG